MQCAVAGTSKRISGSMLIEVPPDTSATFLANAFAWGMYVGTFAPRLTRDFLNGQNHGRSQAISMWPSKACMHSRITLCRAHPRGQNTCVVLIGCRRAERKMFFNQS